MCVYFSEREDRPNQQEEEEKKGVFVMIAIPLSPSLHIYIYF